MKILWNPDAVETALTRTKRARQALEDCVGKSAEMRTMLLSPAEDGEADRALLKAMERFEEIAQRLKRLDDETGNFNLALHQANANFETAEREVLQMVRELDSAGSGNSAYGGDAGTHWNTMHGGTMPEMREDVWILPDWLGREVLSSAER